MKNLFQIKLLVIVACSLLFSECKKGEGDPGVTLRTRKARMVGEWRLKSGNAGQTFAKTGSPSISQGLVFDGSTARMSETTLNGGTPTLYIFAYLLNLNIQKDGTFVLTENYGSYNLIATGTWNFTSGIGESKNKEEVIFIIEKVDAGETVGHVFNKQNTEFSYKISTLKNKELILEAGTKTYLHANGEHVSYSGTFEMKQD